MVIYRGIILQITNVLVNSALHVRARVRFFGVRVIIVIVKTPHRLARRALRFRHARAKLLFSAEARRSLVRHHHRHSVKGKRQRSVRPAGEIPASSGRDQRRGKYTFNASGNDNAPRSDRCSNHRFQFHSLQRGQHIDLAAHNELTGQSSLTCSCGFVGSGAFIVCPLSVRVTPARHIIGFRLAHVLLAPGRHFRPP